MKQHYIAFILLFLLAGCAHNADNKVWIKPGASTNEFNVDKYDCIQQAQQKSSSAYVNPYGGVAGSGTITNWGLYNACMNAKGWTLQDSNNLSKTLDPNSAEFKQKQSNYLDAMNKFKEKGKAICEKKEYAELFVHTSCFSNNITFEQIADNTKINPTQKAILPKYRTEVEAVTKERFEYLRKNGLKNDKLIVDYIESTQPEIDKYNLDLFNGIITWGEYNQRRKDAYARLQAEVKKFNPSEN